MSGRFVSEQARRCLDRGYGLFVTWHALSEPRHGQRPSFEQMVNEFDVRNFADQVAEAGAGYCIFSVTHVLNYLPFPSDAMDLLLPGRTCERDLMGELHEQLRAHDIPLLFYFSSQTHDDPAFAEAIGWPDDSDRWPQCFYELAADIGRRYGNRLAGWWIDNCRPDVRDGAAEALDFEAYAAALRTGNEDRVLAFNISGIGNGFNREHIVEDVADISGGHLNYALEMPDLSSLPPAIAPHLCEHMDTSPRWFYNGENRVLAYTTEEVVDFVRQCMDRQVVFSYNTGPWGEGDIPRETMAQLRALRKAIRN